MKNPTTSTTKPAGFTLVELLVVIAIIAVLVGISIPVITKFRRTADQSRCVSNLHQMGPLLELYKADHNGNYPSPGINQGGGNGWKMWDSEDLAQYVHKAKSELAPGEDNEVGTIFECPAAARDLKSKGVNPSSNNNGYGLNKALPASAFFLDGKKQGPHSSMIEPLQLKDSARVGLIMDCEHAICGPIGNSLEKVKSAASRHSSSINVLFADFHVSNVKLSKLPEPGSPEGDQFWEAK